MTLSLLIVSFNKEPFSVQVDASERVDTLLMIICFSCKLTTSKFNAFHNLVNISLTPSALISSLGIANNDIIELKPKSDPTTAPLPPSMAISSTASSSSSSYLPSVTSSIGGGLAGFGSGVLSVEDIPNGATPEQWLEITESNPNILLELRSAGDDELADSLGERDLVKLRTLFMKRYMSQHKKVFMKERELAAIAANPDDPENQAKMLEQIRAQNVQENMENAMENYPETFARVNMLYVYGEINGKPLKIFVDSGAQVTVISKRCMELCNLDRIMDTRYQGEMRGVGVGRMLGKIHLAQIKLGNSFFPISLSVLESSDVDMLLGLDMLKRHRCIIDLSSNPPCLRMETGSGSSSEAIPFLADAELPGSEDSDHPARRLSSGNGGGV